MNSYAIYSSLKDLPELELDLALSKMESSQINSQDFRKVTPLMCAALEDDLLVAKHLVKYGADLKAFDCNRQTALFWAVQSHENSEVAEFLIESGADVNWVDKRLNTPLILAVFARSIEVTKRLLEKDANVQAADKLGNTALHYAAQKEEKELIYQLLKKNANLYLINNYGATSLEYIQGWEPKLYKHLKQIYKEEKLEIETEEKPEIEKKLKN